MPRNDQAVRQFIILNKLESFRHGLTLEQLAEELDPSAGMKVVEPDSLRSAVKQEASRIVNSK